MKKESKSRRSLRVQIGLLYTLLAFVNIIFFSVMIFSNQRDLLILNFRYQADNLVKSVQERLEKESVPLEPNGAFEDFKAALKANEITDFTIYDDKGVIWHSAPDTSQRGKQVPDELKRKSIELSADLTLYRSSYLKT
ncbi:MAG TPA: hypothetical protein PLW55_10165, partial [Leptospiraceae bacterium]|nr:hypothetical protein [Leptospiraceae bacterium]